MTFPEILTVAFALVGLGLLCAIVATALVDLWRVTVAQSRDQRIRRPFRISLIVVALVFVAALLGAGVVLILATVIL